MPLINYEINLPLKWSRKCIIVAGTADNQNPTFKINDTKFYVPDVTLSTQEDIKLLKQLESGFKTTITWNKYLVKTTNQARNRYVDYLSNALFQGVNRLFVLSTEDDDGRDSHKQYFLPTVEIKDYNVMIVEEISLIIQLKIIWKHMITSGKLQPVKVMIIQKDCY